MGEGSRTCWFGSDGHERTHTLQEGKISGVCLLVLERVLVCRAWVLASASLWFSSGGALCCPCPARANAKCDCHTRLVFLFGSFLCMLCLVCESPFASVRETERVHECERGLVVYF